MKHVFIINPTAGKRDATVELMEMAKGLQARHGLEVECILTKRAGHAAETARSMAQTGEDLRFYACGGDGTINEVANGIIGLPNAAMTCVPVGTGNDFLKNFGDAAPLFSDPENLFDGPQFPLDAIECNGRAALTIACSGFDAQVAHDVHRFGQSPLLGSRSSYIASLAVNFLLRDLGHTWTVTLDGQSLTGSFVLASVCNGRYYGGGFMPVAEARMDDGVLDTLVVRKVSRLRRCCSSWRRRTPTARLLDRFPQYRPPCCAARQVRIQSQRARPSSPAWTARSMHTKAAGSSRRMRPGERALFRPPGLRPQRHRPTPCRHRQWSQYVNNSHKESPIKLEVFAAYPSCINARRMIVR